MILQLVLIEMGDVNKADTDQEYLWLHDRLVKLHAVFQPLVGETQ